jgi:hypothetical protein
MRQSAEQFWKIKLEQQVALGSRSGRKFGGVLQVYREAHEKFSSTGRYKAAR